MNLFKKFKTFDEILPSFLADIKMQIGAKSYLSYTGKVRVFSDWLYVHELKETPLNKLTSQDISEFFSYLAGHRNLDKPTCQKYAITIRKVFQYAQKRDEVEVMPFDLVSYPKKKADMSSEVINPEHIKVLLGAIKKKDPQLYLACMTQYFTFLRPGSELRLLKVRDINLEVGTIQVVTDHAKNGHKRIVTMPTQLIELCKEQGIDKAGKDLFVFGKHKRPDSQPCSVNMLTYRFNKYRDKFGMPKGYKLYSWKHTGATTLHNSNTVSLHELMQQLGHSKLSSTEHYIKKQAGIVNTRIRDHFPSPI